ncbi:hypothetical protein [Streptomyces sp. YPW6]|uniref:hypothetical protein n=1 Tax=Streptomyces sp. YPW6 TaxID=2840373 RepID=UPI00209ACD19|nr:hypothetical protein [Streptomyces sp. YPW6]
MTPARPAEDQVSDKTAQALRAAMQRLIAGKPQHTDGKLTKENLWREAQVSRATMNRAPSILAEWDAYVAVHGKVTRGEAQRDGQIAELRKKLRAKTQECTGLEKRLKAAATAIAALHHDNEALREELGKRSERTVVELSSRRRGTTENE